MKSSATRARMAAGTRRRWARLPKEEKRTVKVYRADADFLHALARWPDVGESPALTLRALLAATRGRLWRLDKNGHPKPTVAFFGPMQGSPR